MSFTLSSGLREATGDSLVTSTNTLRVSGTVYWLDSVTGDNANDGVDKMRPVATLAQAITNATDDDIIVVLSTHNESIGSQVTISKRLTIVGAGSSGGVPTAKFTRNFNGVMFSAAADCVRLLNLKFPASTAASASNRINSAGSGLYVKGCYFESGADDTGPALNLAGDYPTIEGTTFVSTSAGVAPYPALYWSTTRVGIRIKDVVGNSGTVGFKHSSHVGSPFADGLAGEARGISVEGLTLLNGADFFIFANGGYVSWSATGAGSLVTI